MYTASPARSEGSSLEVEQDGLQKPPWRRTLWESQQYSDNYVPLNFLKQLRTDPSSSQPTLFTLIVWSLPLTQHLSTILLFVSLFLHLRARHITSEALAVASVAAIILLASTTPATSIFSMPPPDPNEVVDEQKRAENRKKHARPLAQPLSYALLALILSALSPLLRTLTEATTSDSIAAFSSALFLLGFILADFSSLHSSPSPSDTDHHYRAQNQLPATLSLNASICSSIVLASRLPSPTQVFALILSSICLFAFVPRWSRYHLPANRTRPTPSLCYTIILTLSSSSLLAFFSPTAATANICSALFLSVICPAWMRKAQSWKVGRSGPWDVGVPRIRRHGPL